MEWSNGPLLVHTRQPFAQLSIDERWGLLNQGESPAVAYYRGRRLPMILWDVDFLGGRPPVRTPTQTELQAHVLLHEIGHLTGATVHASNGAHAAVDARITESCFKDFNY